ncbi:hypothetical protein Zmor_002147 [Zophobas morio]|uniref:Uncharacterized protein n=1 Tax=Zophobas morio TaxID=2755281 RepID=A0AA38MT78_9CUCU|nr:hypothetical protein Zmor_002147 [Zophobas morio]
MGKSLILFSLLVTAYHLVEAGLTATEDPKSAETEAGLDAEIGSDGGTGIAGGLDPETGSDRSDTDKGIPRLGVFEEELEDKRRRRRRDDESVYELIREAFYAIKKSFENFFG